MEGQEPGTEASSLAVEERVGTAEAVCPRRGWGVLHLFLHPTAGADAARAAAALAAMEADGYQVVVAALLGHKADLCVMLLGPDLWRLRRAQSELVHAGLAVVDSFVSLTEVSEYAAGMPAERLEPRLHPVLPPAGKPAFCFYPMSKRRHIGQNWYTLPYEDRERLMYEHGRHGRTFAGKVLQVVTGATGVDDWEWGVTLFGEHPDDLKEVVYQLRFDEASALYAEFGPFCFGMVSDLDTAWARLGWP
jgi:chlorite dismutase